MTGSIYNWSTTAASNANSDGDINFAEGQAPSTVNNSARQVMGRVAEYIADQGGALTAGGTADALTVTANSAFTAYADGRTLALRITTDNTTAATLNVNGLGAKPIRKMVGAGESALTGAELQATGIYLLQYSTALNSAAGGWLLLNPTIDVPNLATLTGSETLTNKTLTAPTINTPALVNGTSSGMTLTTATLTSPTLTTPTLTLKQSTTPTPTAEGDVQWDTDDNVLVVGDGAATKIFLPIPASTAAGDLEYFTAAKVKARLAKGSDGQILQLSSGLPIWAGGRAQGTAVASTSGTAIDFTGIPSWATQVSIALAGVSTSGTSMMVLRLGSSSGGIEATGYVGATVNAGSGAGSVGANYSTGFNIAGNIVAGENQSGVLTLTLLDASANQWACGVSTGNGAVAYSVGGGGYKSLTSTLDRVRLTMVNGTDTFDAGKVNISWM